MSGFWTSTADQLTKSALMNNSSTVSPGSLIRISKTVSLVNSISANYDTTIWQSPTNFVVMGVFIKIASNVTGTSHVSTIKLGTSIGGAEVLVAYSLLGTETTLTDPIGLASSTLGTDFVIGGIFRKFYPTATTFTLRQILTSGTINTGSVTVEILGYVLN